MKKQFLPLVLVMLLGLVFNANAQRGKYKKETIISKAVSAPDANVDALQKPVNKKDAPVKESKKRGDVFGPDYSDVVIDNWTGYYIDIYVMGSDGEYAYRGTVSPYDKKVTWAIPGENTLYGKAVFDDGSYKYWGPRTTTTGYQYTWKLNP